jgi:hypothetical protein
MRQNMRLFAIVVTGRSNRTNIPEKLLIAPIYSYTQLQRPDIWP